MMRMQVRRQVQIRKHARNNRSLALEIERILPPARKPSSSLLNRETQK